MATPFTYSSSLAFPVEAGTPAAARPINYSGSYETVLDVVHKFPAEGGAETFEFNAPNDVGAKVFEVRVDADSSPAAQPIMVDMNTTSEGPSVNATEVWPGGFISAGLPRPTAAGVRRVTVYATTSCTVRVRALG